MRLTLQLLTGTKYFLHVNPEDKVRKVKVDIFKELEIKSKVRLMWQNQLMEDRVTLRALGIIDEATVQMIIEPETQVTLTIQTVKKGVVSVLMNDSDTVGDLVKKLSHSTLMALALMDDFYFEQFHLSEENLPFHFYGIVDGSIIIQRYEGSFKIELRSSRGLRFLKYVTVKATSTIEDLSDKIVVAINEDDDDEVSEDDIVIFYRKGRHKPLRVYHELDRDSLTLAQCGIEPLDEFTFIRYDDVTRSSIDILIENSTGNFRKRKLCRLDESESVQSLKLKIQHQLHIPHEKQALYLDGVVMTTLKDEINHKKFEDILIKVHD